ncbi:MAG: ribosomal protein L13e [Sulfolobales archaeon]|nr:ribosomal protein L13e [Sulfolobales archaeon]MDW8083509.1 ribosomal protein L13e [Sulfolobales archaeon]
MDVKPYVKSPVLMRDRGVVKNLRQGRGFSECELERVGLSIGAAKSLGIHVDVRRKSCHEWNVKILQEFLAKSSGGSQSA